MTTLTKKESNFMKYYAKYIGILMILVLTACAAPKVTLFPDSRDALQEFTLEGSGTDKVLMIPVNGFITHRSEAGFIRQSPSMVQEIVAHLAKAEKDEHVKAVLLKIDSPGGSATANDLIYHEILSFKRRTNKPIIAAMMNVAASGGYYIALPADVIIAHPTTVTGSVGVIFMRPSMVGFSQKIGINMEVNKSGINKDMGSPFREQSKAEKAIFQKVTNQLGQRFINLVKKHRKISPESEKEIATARIFLADRALKLGMIDKIGYLSDALIQIKKMAKITPNAKVVVYRRSEFKNDNIYNIATSHSASGLNLVQMNLLLNKAFSETGFYYLWLPALIAP
jgi:protease-4